MINIMKPAEFTRRINKNPRPVVVDLWAPWCAPCRAMEPAFAKTSQKYSGQVDVIKVNADESPDVLRSLRVMSIPTTIGFANGKEILRRTGLQSAAALDILFDATLHQRKPAINPPTPIARLVRSAAGIAVVIAGWFSGHSIWLIALGGVLLFSAFYDRCPIYRAIVPRITAFFQRKNQPHHSSS